jgi:NTE family protein
MEIQIQFHLQQKDSMSESIAHPNNQLVLLRLGGRAVSLAIVMMLTSLQLFGQTGQAKQKRPKVGVALAGGAALGLSHVGVLQWFEEHRIPVDYIAGTSMGGLVGGLYATGYRAAEMKEFVKGIDWEDALRLAPAYSDLSFRRKEDSRAYPTVFELGLKQGVQLPPGLSPGEGVGKVISRFAAPYEQLDSFDTLPIPFRCVASELISGKQVVFEKGPLFDALRSTMSLPAIFAPWRVGDKMLVDGAVLNNLPVDVVKKMGADIVIAVALDSPPITDKDVKSFFGVAGRSITIMIMDNERRSLAMADIVVAGDLKGFTGTQYDRSEEFFKVGYEGAASKARVLEPLALSQAEYDEHVRQRLQRRRPNTITPQFIDISGTTPSTASEIKALFETDTKGKPLDRKTLEGDLDRITGLGPYSSADYGFAKKDGADGLDLRIHQKEHAPPTLNLLLLLDAASGEGLRFGAGGRLTFLDVLKPRAEWRTDFNIGGINEIATEYYMPLGRSRIFIAPRAGYAKGEIPFYEGDRQVATVDTDNTVGGVDLGFAQSRFTEWRVGYNHTRSSAEIADGVPIFASVDGRFNRIRLRHAFDRMDSNLIPRHGLRAISEAQWVMNSPRSGTGFLVLDSQLSFANSFNPRWSMISTAAGGTKPDRADRIPTFTLGGLTKVSSLGRNQLYGNNYYYGGTALLRSLSQHPSLLGKFYAALLGEVGRAFMENQSKTPYFSGTVGIAGETPLGLIFFGYSLGDKGQSKLQFRLGRLF